MMDLLTTLLVKLSKYTEGTYDINLQADFFSAKSSKLGDG